MRINGFSFAWLLLVLLTAASALRAQTDSAPSREYAIKAAFLYNLAKFVDWPDDKPVDSNDTIVIGIVGKDPFADAFQPILDKRVQGKKLLIKRFEGVSQLRKEKDSNEDKSAAGGLAGYSPPRRGRRNSRFRGCRRNHQSPA